LIHELKFIGNYVSHHQIYNHALHRWGLQDLLASFLEAAGPLTLIGAQVLYVGQPILRDFVPAAHLRALTSMLEDNVQRDDFVNCLREET